MSLIEWQRALVGALHGRVPGEVTQELAVTERASEATLIASEGFRFTAAIQRSWCVGRAGKAARLTLSVLPAEQARQLLEQWVNLGGGTSSFFAAEADAFLEFIARTLPDPSHARTICRVEQATLRASAGVVEMVQPDLRRLAEPAGELRMGRYAALVPFYAEPRLLLGALEGAALPPLSPKASWVLFAPGIENLFRGASDDERDLLQRLRAPAALESLLGDGHNLAQIEALLSAGALEFGSSSEPSGLGPNTRVRV